MFSYARSLGIGRKLIDGALVWLGSGRPSPRTGCGDIPAHISRRQRMAHILPYFGIVSDRIRCRGIVVFRDRKRYSDLA